MSDILLELFKMTMALDGGTQGRQREEGVRRGESGLEERIKRKKE